MEYYKSLVLRIAIPFILSYELIQKVSFYLTINSSKLILSILSKDTFLIGNFISYKETFVKFIPACSASSAYFLLLLLIVFTKDIKLKRGIKIFLIGSLIIFLVNTIRIIVLILLLENNSYKLFSSIHSFFWIFVASILVAVIWIWLTRKYRIKSIPIYTDLKYLLKKIKVFK